ncbi:MAG: DnaJ-like protein DjlA [Candidatus Scalindua rubra]|uniref:DnaJ-like protein DjlA n=1 Tax=Candidatus Scalindua rubra TaxID=1872076 RepID=A0A1E3X7K9_9BACT|nr:MAG: DnaJ-like protein DjlA [Candidatus Scalindua rubra]
MYIHLYFDDLIASGFLYYLWQKFKNQKRQRNFYSKSQSQENRKTESKGDLNLEDAYKILGVSPNASLKEVQKAYKDKIVKSHPDKVTHLSKELQEKAKEVTAKLNKAIEIIKRHKKV